MVILIMRKKKITIVLATLGTLVSMFFIGLISFIPSIKQNINNKRNHSPHVEPDENGNENSPLVVAPVENINDNIPPPVAHDENINNNIPPPVAYNENGIPHRIAARLINLDNNVERPIFIDDMLHFMQASILTRETTQGG
ncbi:hypothetical protein HEP_00353800 [Hepatocystis sp. ex Piliocolobus tephrosceles]|nr:hypothetical protein HEP_00353800 [Hepatocystis sp. ex Piliocolobus tephrosceles]